MRALMAVARANGVPFHDGVQPLPVMNPRITCRLGILGMVSEASTYGAYDGAAPVVVVDAVAVADLPPPSVADLPAPVREQPLATAPSD